MSHLVLWLPPCAGVVEEVQPKSMEVRGHASLLVIVDVRDVHASGFLRQCCGGGAGQEHGGARGRQPAAVVMCEVLH
jgi:hypothetical protein